MIYTVLYSEKDASETKLSRVLLASIFNGNATIPLYRDIDTRDVFSGTKAFNHTLLSDKEIECAVEKYKKQYPDAKLQSENAERQSFISKLLVKGNENVKLGF